MSANAAPSPSTFFERVRRRSRNWLRDVLPAAMRRKFLVVVKKGPFESVMGEETPRRFLPYRPLEDEPPWYRSDDDLPLVLTDSVKEFYWQYTGLKTPELEVRLRETRRQAWLLGNYPAFGNWTFARDTLRAHPFYPELLSRLKGGATLLEAGSGLGQDLRYLAHDGAPTDRMLAVDYRLDLWKLGYTLFNDDGWYVQKQKQRWKKQQQQQHHHHGSSLPPGNHKRDDFRVRFIEANLYSYTFAEQYKKLHGTFDIVMANNFFNNVVDWSSSKWMVRCIEPYTKVGTIFMGYHFAPITEFVYSSDDMSYFDRRELQDIVFDEGMGNPETREIQWVIDSYTTVDLKEWGLEEKHWNWVRHCQCPDKIQQMRGAYYVVRRIR